MDALGYIILLVTIVTLVAAVVYLDNRRNRWLDISRALAEELAQSRHAEKFYATMYSLACSANQTMAEGVQSYREANEQLKATLEDLVPPTPSVSPDDAISAMRYCGTCHTWMHPNHFVVQPQHFTTSAPN